VNFGVWTERNGAARVTAYRWFRVGVLPVVRKVGRLVLVEEPAGAACRLRAKMRMSKVHRKTST
jgi:predicted site-specific integrase-resolvase